MAVAVLGGPEIAEDAERVGLRPRRQQAAGDLHQVAGPDDVVADRPDLLVGPRLAPGGREAGDDGPGEALVLVGPEDRGAGAEEVAAARPVQLRRGQGPLPVPPLAGVFLPDRVEVVQQAGPGAVPGLGGGGPEAQGLDEHAARGDEVHLADQGHVAVLGPLVGPDQPAVASEVAQAVGPADEAGGGVRPGDRACQGQDVARPLGEEHRHALVTADPGRVVPALVGHLGVQEREEAIISQPTGERDEPRALQDDVEARMGQDRLLDPVAPEPAGVDEFEGGDALGQPAHLVAGVMPLVRVEASAVGHDLAQAPDGRPVGPGIEDLGEGAEAEGEPDAAGGPALRPDGGADAVLGGEVPARDVAGAAGGLASVGPRSAPGPPEGPADHRDARPQEGRVAEVLPSPACPSMDDPVRVSHVPLPPILVASVGRIVRPGSGPARSPGRGASAGVRATRSG